MHHFNFNRTGALILSLLLALLLPSLGAAKEESKMQTPLSAINGNGNGNGNGKNGPRADVRTHLQGSKVDLQLRVKSLEGDTEYVLLCRDGEGEFFEEEAELARFTTSSNGSANETFDLSKGDESEAPVDPRGCYLVVATPATDTEDANAILGAWLYGDAEEDERKARVKEVTSLEPDEENDPDGRVDATYRRLPNGNGQLTIAFRGLAEGEYEIHVDDDAALNPVAILSPNSGGNARADFRTKPSKGNGSGKVKPHNKRKELGFDPRRKLIEIVLDDGTDEGALVFSGPMLAQIDGLNSCTPGLVSQADLVDGGTATGTAKLEQEEDCETAFEVMVEGVDADGMYDVYADGVMVGSFQADPSGTGSVRFDPTPDEGENEVELTVPVAIDAEVEIIAVGAETPTLLGTLVPAP